MTWSKAHWLESGTFLIVGCWNCSRCTIYGNVCMLVITFEQPTVYRCKMPIVSALFRMSFRTVVCSRKCWRLLFKSIESKQFSWYRRFAGSFFLCRWFIYSVFDSSLWSTSPRVSAGFWLRRFCCRWSETSTAPVVSALPADDVTEFLLRSADSLPHFGCGIPAHGQC